MYTLPPLPYNHSALEPWVDTETMKLHHDKHHQAYVDNLNKALDGQADLLKLDISELVTKLDKVPENIRTKVRNNAGGHFNHSLFWETMTPETTSMSTELSQEIASEFGGIEKFQEEFSAKALAHFGSGWVWLVKDNDKLKIEDSDNQDNPLMQNSKATILLGLDVWEHAYYLKYKNMRAEYIKSWWNIVNWTEVSKRNSK